MSFWGGIRNNPRRDPFSRVLPAAAVGGAARDQADDLGESMKHCPTCNRRLLALDRCIACADAARDEQLARNTRPRTSTGSWPKTSDYRKPAKLKEWGLRA